MAIATAAFQLVLIKPLDHRKTIERNYSYHAVWHPVVLGLAIPPNPLAMRQGIQWDDRVGLVLARRVDPNARYLGPTYESALRSYYFGLWRDHPAAMLDIYHRKVFETARGLMAALATIFNSPTLGAWAETAIPNGYVWYWALFVASLLGLLALKLDENLAAFTTLLAGGLICISMEQTIIIPYFFLNYQGSLVVGIAAVAAMVIVLVSAALIRLAAPSEALVPSRLEPPSGNPAIAGAAPVRRRLGLPGSAGAWPAAALIAVGVVAGWLLSRVPAPSNIIELADGSWDRVFAPARLVGHELKMQGAPVPTGYAAISVRYHLPQGIKFEAAGTVRQGGVMLGLIASNGRWAATRAFLAGPFHGELEAPTDGDYRIVLANNLSRDERTIDAAVNEVGMAGADPDRFRVDPLHPSPERPALAAAAGQITPIEPSGWARIVAPARIDANGLSYQGAPSSPSASIAESGFYRFTKGTVVAAAGIIEHGGLMFGVFDKREHWATAAAIPQGPFRSTIDIPTDGDYRIVVANNLPPGETVNDIAVREVGVVGVGAAELAKAGKPSPEIRPLGEEAWQIVNPPAQVEGARLTIRGAVSNPSAYAAVSVFYRLPKGALVAAAGTVMNGRIMLGLLDKRGEWAVAKWFSAGPFRAAVQAPADGDYRIVIGNALLPGQTINDAEVTEIGLVGLDPASLRVGAEGNTNADQSKAGTATRAGDGSGG